MQSNYIMSFSSFERTIGPGADEKVCRSQYGRKHTADNMSLITANTCLRHVGVGIYFGTASNEYAEHKARWHD
jgi:hypothetical protein